MLYMVVETFHPGKVSELYKRFDEKGRMLPEGVRYLNSWIDDKLTRCYQLMECDEPALMDDWVAHWRDMADFEIIPVLTSAEARQRVRATARA